VLNMIYVFNSFPIIYTLNESNPGFSHDTTITFMYKLAFKSAEKDVGQSAAAVGSIIFGLTFNIVLFLAAPLLLTNLAFIGDGNNVCNDLLLGCSKLAINIRVSTPIGFEPPDWVVEKARSSSKKNKSVLLITSDPTEAVVAADVIVTDTHISIGKENEFDSREKIFFPKYQVNDDLVKYAKKDFIFMHCLPAKRGKEVTSQIIDGPHSVIWSEAENRLHVQKALLIKILGDSSVHNRNHS